VNHDGLEGLTHLYVIPGNQQEVHLGLKLLYHKDQVAY
jgi:hypothetical protein